MNLLVFEELTASPGLWRDSTDSMRFEALQMLKSILRDFCHIESVVVHVLLSDDARSMLLGDAAISSSERFQTITSNGSPAEWLSSPTIDPKHFHGTFVIAPESDGMLTERLRAMQASPWTHASSFNVARQLAEVFSDKRATYDWLSERGIVTSTTWILPEFLNASRVSSPTSVFILKPRDGAGSDRVQCLSPEQLHRVIAMIPTSEHDRWIVQPRIPGQACSFGLIGGGNGRLSTILPGALQKIAEDSGALSYRGGIVPCDKQLQESIAPLALRMQQALGAFYGYIGVDVVVPAFGLNSSEPDQLGRNAAHVIEVNPRLCTSYVGYQKLCRQNLARKILCLPSPDLEWHDGNIEF